MELDEDQSKVCLCCQSSLCTHFQPQRLVGFEDGGVVERDVASGPASSDKDGG